MPEQLMPDAMAATLADMNRRLQVLEATSRVGLAGVRYCTQSAGVAATVYEPAWDTGGAGNTWVDDTGATGTGYAQLTIENMPSKALVMWGARPVNVANSATFRSRAVNLAVQMAGFDGYVQRQFDNANVAPIAIPMVGARVFYGFVRTTWTFKLEAQWLDTLPAAVNKPQMSDGFLLVMPLST